MGQGVLNLIDIGTTNKEGMAVLVEKDEMIMPLTTHNPLPLFSITGE